MSKSKLARILALMLAFSLFAIGCGGGDDDSGSTARVLPKAVLQKLLKQRLLKKKHLLKKRKLKKHLLKKRKLKKKRLL